MTCLYQKDGRKSIHAIATNTHDVCLFQSCWKFDCRGLDSSWCFWGIGIDRWDDLPRSVRSREELHRNRAVILKQKHTSYGFKFLNSMRSLSLTITFLFCWGSVAWCALYEQLRTFQESGTIFRQEERLCRKKRHLPCDPWQVQRKWSDLSAVLRQTVGREARHIPGASRGFAAKTGEE